jgi:hypothetical protein
MTENEKGKTMKRRRAKFEVRESDLRAIVDVAQSLLTELRWERGGRIARRATRAKRRPAEEQPGDRRAARSLRAVH